ncbi:MAG: hypothetical protein K2N63_14465, partial [Lachnospiraceae bacterium]|nr:hypothetical protein [Lachnospiraceae bacterium]
MKKDGKENTMEKESGKAGQNEKLEKEILSAGGGKEQIAAAPVKINKKKVNAYKRRQNRLGYLFMLPWILGFLVFTMIPFVMTIYLSFTEVKQDIRGFNIVFTGIYNYRQVFLVNTDFTPALVSFLGMILPYTMVV